MRSVCSWLSRHILVSLALEDLVRHVPHENGALGTNRDNGPLIRGHGDLVDVSRVTNSVEVADTLIVVPELDSLVLASRDEVLSSLSDGQGVDLASLGAVKHPDSLTVEAVPVGDLSVAASGEHLRLIRVVKNLLEHGGLEESHHSGLVDDVPNDARAIVGGGNSLGVLLVDLDVADSSSVLLERALHDLSLSANSPDSNFSLHSTGHDLLAVLGASNGGDSVVVSVVDGEQQLSRLWEESSDLAIVPAGEDGLSVRLEEHAEALEAWHLNSQELLAGLGVPDSDVVEGAGGEELGVASWESNIVDSLVVASVPQLWVDGVGVAPVDGSLGGSTEEVSGVGGERDRCNGSHNLCLLLHKHVLGSNLGDGAVSGTNEEVSVGEKVDAVDALREESLSWANPLEEVVGQGDLNDISSLGSQVGEGVSWVNDAANEDSLDGVHENLVVLHLLLDEVAVPGSDAVVVDGEALGGGVVEEANLVGDIHANWISNKCFAALDLNNI